MAFAAVNTGNGFILPPLVKSIAATIDWGPQRYFHLQISWILAAGEREASTFIWVKSPSWRNSQRGSFIRQAQSNISNIQSKSCIGVVIFALAWQWLAGDLGVCEEIGVGEMHSSAGQLSWGGADTHGHPTGS